MSAEPLPEARAVYVVPGARPLTVEVIVVTLLCLAFLVPGIWGYSLVDPWETHYGEVARRMLQDHDWVHTDWQNEGFRSKPVLTFWLMAASMRAVGLAADGGYSGEMVSTPLVMLAIRLPFVLFGVMGLVTTWWMLARLISRRVAYLGLLVVGTCPFFVLVARQGITDMTLVGCMMGAIAMFAMATEDGDRSIQPLGRIGPFSFDSRHVFFLLIGLFVAWQAGYYLLYFALKPQLAGIPFPVPGVILCAFMVLLFAGVIGWPVRASQLPAPVRQLVGIEPIRRTGQVYMLWFYALLAISVLGKGLPALGIVGVVCLFYVLILRRWRDLWSGLYEVKRGILLNLCIAVPWHVAMWLKDGRRFLNEYFITHLLNRAAVGVFGDRGTFDFYLSQLGYGMFVWAALVPAAVVAATTRNGVRTREGRVRMIVAIWAITSVAFFSLVQTKFHHYILPAVPALGLLIAFWLDDLLAGRARTSWVFCVLGAGIILLLARDMIHEEKQWIEMFVFRYDRPWPTGQPWAVDTTSGFLGLGLFGAAAVLVLGVPRLLRLGVVLVGTAGIAVALWAMHAYMPEAGTHWGMREAVRTYYDEREVFGEKLVYYGAGQLADDWAGVKDHRTFETYVPDHLLVGQPMTFDITVRSVDDRSTEQELTLVGPVTAIDGPRVTVALAPDQLARLRPLLQAGQKGRRATRRPIKVVDAERLFAWQLYWRGENFWSGDEIWGRLPEMQTALKDTDNVKFLKYLNDPTVAKVGHRYFVVTEAGRISSLRSILPTARAKETFEVLDTTSNKFTLASFTL